MTEAIEKTEEEELAEAKAAEEAKIAADIKAAEELEEGDDASLKAKEAEEAEAAKKAAEAKDKEGEDEPTSEELLQEEIANLKEKYATSDSATKALEAKLIQLNKVMKDAGMEVEEEDPEQQKFLENTANARREYLSNIFEMMSVNPKYPDLAEVMTTHNKQLVIEAYAGELLKDDPTIAEETAIAAVKQTVNELSNPHKFFYEQIKILEKGSKEENKEIKKKDPIVTDAPGSVNKMGGGGGDGGAWTLSKLDNMSEENLAKADISQSILDQWKAGTLAK